MNNKLNFLNKLGVGGVLIVAAVLTTIPPHWHAFHGIPVPFSYAVSWVVATIFSFVFVLWFKSDGATTLIRLRLLGFVLCTIIASRWLSLDFEVIVSILLTWRWADILLMCKAWNVSHSKSA